MERRGGGDGGGGCERKVEQSDVWEARGPVKCGVSKKVILAPTVVCVMIGVALPERAGDHFSMHVCTAHSGMFEAKSNRRRVTWSCRLTATQPRARAIQL